MKNQLLRPFLMLLFVLSWTPVSNGQESLPVVPARLQLERSFQSGPLCGPNALYLLLRLHGVSVKYEDVVNSIELSDEGCSLEDLKQAAAKFGVSSTCRGNVSANSLTNNVLPAIVHLAVDPSNPIDQNRDHFLVITNEDEDSRFHGIDTNAMIPVAYDRGSLAHNLTGNALFVKASPRRKLLRSVRGYRFAVGFCGLVWTASLGLAVWRRFRG